MEVRSRKTDVDLHKDVVEELEFDPRVDSSNIAVAVHDRIVTLRGMVPTLYQRYDAESAVKRVDGVRGVANELEVELIEEHLRTDTDIAHAAVQAMSSNVALPETIQVAVRDGWITLSGTVEWRHQREEAEAMMRSLTGVRGITNLIDVARSVAPENVRTRLRRAFERAAQYDASRIAVDVHGSSVTLRGIVRSFAEMDEAVRAAWSVPGVRAVDNQLMIEA